MPRLDFVPARDGFHFANHFANHLGPFTSYGRCGGMTYAALDYYLTQRPVPTHAEGDFGGQPAPHDRSRLADYILRRQIASLANAGAAKFLTWQGFWTSARERVERTVQQEFPELRRRVDAGSLSPLGLVSSGGVTDSHQVLAYGYDLAAGMPVTYIYDNNYPDRECALRPNASMDAIEEYDLSADPDMTQAPLETWRGWFVHDDYDLAHPHQPDYQDLQLTGQPAIDGTALRYAVINAGEYEAHVQVLGAQTRSPRNELLGAGLASSAAEPLRLSPGAGQQGLVALPTDAGRLQVLAAMQTDQGYWQPLVGAVDAPTPAEVTFTAALAP